MQFGKILILLNTTLFLCWSHLYYIRSFGILLIYFGNTVFSPSYSTNARPQLKTLNHSSPSTLHKYSVIPLIDRSLYSTISTVCPSFSCIVSCLITSIRALYQVIVHICFDFLRYFGNVFAFFFGCHFGRFQF